MVPLHLVPTAARRGKVLPWGNWFHLRLPRKLLIYRKGWVEGDSPGKRFSPRDRSSKCLYLCVFINKKRRWGNWGSDLEEFRILKTHADVFPFSPSRCAGTVATACG